MPLIDNRLEAKISYRIINNDFRHTGHDIVHPAVYYPKYQADALKIYQANVESGKYSFEYIPCPFCSSSQFTIFSERDRYGNFGPTAVCQRCGLVQSQPMPTEETLTDFYANLYTRIYRGVVDGHAGRLIKPTKSAVKFAERVKSHNIFADVPAGGRIVEVGCGNGHIVKHLSDIYTDFLFTGFDFDEEYMKNGISIGLDMRLGRFRDYEDMKNIDVIYYHQVFEHIRDIGSEIEHVKRALKPGGKLVLAVPGILNGLGSPADLMQYLQNAHTYYFDLTSLVRYFSKHGFSLNYGSEGILAIFDYTGENNVVLREPASALAPEVEHDRKLFFFENFDKIHRSQLFVEPNRRRIAGYMLRHTHPHTGVVNLSKAQLEGVTKTGASDVDAACHALQAVAGLRMFNSDQDALFRFPTSRHLQSGSALMAELTQAVQLYSDLFSPDDLAKSAQEIADHKSLIAVSERLVDERRFARALAISAVALHRTPNSKAHKLICARCLVELGAADRAERLLRELETLSTGDRSTRSKIKRIRRSTSNGGVSGLVRRVLQR